MSKSALFHSQSYGGSYSIGIFSELTEENKTNIAISVNDVFCIIQPKSEEGVIQITEWHDKIFRSYDFKTSEKLDKLQLLINDTELYYLIEDQKKAYKEFLRIQNKSSLNLLSKSDSYKYPPKPNKSLELLKEWFFEVLEIEKKEFFLASIDKESFELRNTIEIQLIEKLIEEINRLYFPTALSENKPSHLHSSTNKLPSKEHTNNKAFLKWLEQRKAEIDQETKIDKHGSDEKPRKFPLRADYNTQIFKSAKAHHLFELWHTEMFKNKKNHLADYSYLFRQMLVDELIYDTTQKVILDFLIGYEIYLPKVKTLADSHTSTKESLYLKLKDSL